MLPTSLKNPASRVSEPTPPFPLASRSSLGLYEDSPPTDISIETNTQLPDSHQTQTLPPLVDHTISSSIQPDPPAPNITPSEQPRHSS